MSGSERLTCYKHYVLLFVPDFVFQQTAEDKNWFEVNFLQFQQQKATTSRHSKTTTPDDVSRLLGWHQMSRHRHMKPFGRVFTYLTLSYSMETYFYSKTIIWINTWMLTLLSIRYGSHNVIQTASWVDVNNFLFTAKRITQHANVHVTPHTVW